MNTKRKRSIKTYLIRIVVAVLICMAVYYVVLFHNFIKSRNSIPEEDGSYLVVQYSSSGGFIFSGFYSYSLVDIESGKEYRVSKDLLKSMDQDYHGDYASGEYGYIHLDDYRKKMRENKPESISNIEFIGFLDEETVLFETQSNEPFSYINSNPIYSYNKATQEYRFIAELPGQRPVAHGNNIYYLDLIEKWKQYGLYRYNIETKEIEKMTDIYLKEYSNVQIIKYL